MNRARLVVLSMLFAVGCGAGGVGCGIGCPGPPPRTDASAPRKMRFAIIPKALDIPVFNYARTGAERAAAGFGDVEVLWNAPASADQLKQKEILESYITQRVDGIAISALNGDFLTETINRAIDAGIPVTTWDSDAPKSRRIASSTLARVYRRNVAVPANASTAAGNSRCHSVSSQPGSVEASESQTATEEVAVMLDTFSPLGVTAAGRSVSDPGYPFSWAR